MILGGASSSKLDRANESFPLKNSDLVTTSNVAVFDPFFGIRVSSARFTLETFNTYCAELRKTKLSLITPSSSIDNSVTMGVIVESSSIKKSSNGKDYMIWHLSDLMSDKKVKLLIFGDAAQSHWKLQTGFVVALTNPEIASDNNYQKSSQTLTLKVMKSLQILSLGLSADYGTCSALKKNGERCTNYVNVSISPVCIYHIQSEANKLRSFRGSLSAISNERPRYNFKSFKKQQTADGGQLYTVKRTNTFQPKSNVNLFMDSSTITSQKQKSNVMIDFLNKKEVEVSISQSSISSSSTAKTIASQKQKSNVMIDFLNKKEVEVSIPQSSISSSSTAKTITSQKQKSNVMIDFLNKKEVEVSIPQSSISSPINVQSKPKFTLAEQAARKRAAEILKKSQSTDPNSRKRKLEPNSSEKRLSEVKFTNDEIRKLLDKKSAHEIEVQKVERDQETRYFQKKEIEEKIETYATNLMEIKNVSVVSCKTCDYTAVNLAQRCIELGHEYVRHKATKRFFKCRDCKTRTICYTIMPTEACTRCSSKNFVRVPMKDERKIQIERDQLLIRGEERKFVNI